MNSQTISSMNGFTIQTSFVLQALEEGKILLQTIVCCDFLLGRFIYWLTMVMVKNYMSIYTKRSCALGAN